MKKVMFLAASAALALSSCSNEVVETEEIPSVGGLKEIKVSPYVAGQTRADEATSETLMTNGFYMTAYTWGSDETTGDDVTQALIPFQKVTYSDAAGGWTLDDQYYWPEGDVTFVGAYVGGKVTVTNDFGLEEAVGTDAPVIENGIWTNVSVNGQADLMAAKDSTSLSVNGSSVINLQFEHILAKINSITIKTAENSEMLEYKVGEVSIQAYGEATYNFKGDFEVNGDQRSYVVNRGYISSGEMVEEYGEDTYDIYTIGADGITIGENSFMVLPNDLKLRVYYDVFSDDTSVFTVKEDGINNSGHYRVAEMELGLESGSAYDIVVTITGADTPIRVSASVTPWNTVTDPEETEIVPED